MRTVFETLGMVGIGLSVAAYIPQASHLIREHCSAGVSPRAWAMWLVSSLLVGSLAVYRRDYVFISLAIASLLSSTVILLLGRRYRGMACSTHRSPIGQRQTR
jgi:hypothetical protein